MKKTISFFIILSVFLTFITYFSFTPVSQAQNIGSLRNIVTPGFTFKKDLRLGDTDPDVRELQRVLNADIDTLIATDGTGSPGKETTYFGNLTKNAVIRFQNKYKDTVLTINSITVADGLVNRPTRTKLNLLLGEFNTVDSVGLPQSRAGSGTSAGVAPAPVVAVASPVNTGPEMSTCQFVELLISINVIASNKIDQARWAMGCPSSQAYPVANQNSTTTGRLSVDLTVNNLNSVTVSQGTSVTLRWTSTGASSCTANWGTNLGTSGSKSIVATSSRAYTINCLGTNTGTISDTVNVYMGLPSLASASTSPASIWARTRMSDILKNIISTTTSTTTEIAGSASSGSGRPGFPVIATDSKNQPHILVKGEGNSGLYAYNKIGTLWQRLVPYIIKPGGPGNPDIEIDDNDNAWISGNTVVTKPAVTKASCQAALEASGGAFAGTWSVFHDCKAGSGGDYGAGGAATGAAIGGTLGYFGFGVGVIPGVIIGSAVGEILDDGQDNAGKIYAVQFEGVPGCEGLTGLIGLTRGNIAEAVNRGLASNGDTSGTILGRASMDKLVCGVEMTPERQARVDAISGMENFVILGKPIEGEWSVGGPSMVATTTATTSPTGNWVGYVPSIASRSVVNWFVQVAQKHFVGNLSVDPFFPGRSFFMPSQPDAVVEFNTSGGQNPINTMSPGKSGEKIIFEISPRYSTSTATILGVATTTYTSQEGIWHAASGGYNNEPGGYINSTLGARVPWAGTNYANAAGDDGAYVSLGIDWKKPEVAYIASSYNGVVINIWDGDKMLFPANSLHVIDRNAASFGNGIRRFAPQWTPAQGGGAFLCWTGSDGNIKMKYITSEGVSKFGPTVNVARGSQCAMSTDTKGDIDLTYIFGNSVEYKKIQTVASSTTP